MEDIQNSVAVEVKENDLAILGPCGRPVNPFIKGQAPRLREAGIAHESCDVHIAFSADADKRQALAVGTDSERAKVKVAPFREAVRLAANSSRVGIDTDFPEVGAALVGRIFS